MHDYSNEEHRPFLVSFLAGGNHSNEEHHSLSFDFGTLNAFFVTNEKRGMKIHLGLTLGRESVGDSATARHSATILFVTTRVGSRGGLGSTGTS